jgi:DNA-binding CsgD family transcriptional regulator
LREPAYTLAVLGATPAGWPVWLAGHPRWSLGLPERARIFWGDSPPPAAWAGSAIPLLWISPRRPGLEFFRGAGARGWLPSARWRQPLGPALRALQAGLTVWGPRGGGPERRAGDRLTAREQEVLALVAAGRANKQIASELAISESTVKFHLGALYHKLGAVNRAEAVRRGLEEGYRPL